jgi:hypothetical protein
MGSLRTGPGLISIPFAENLMRKLVNHGTTRANITESSQKYLGSDLHNIKDIKHITKAVARLTPGIQLAALLIWGTISYIFPFYMETISAITHAPNVHFT